MKLVWCVELLKDEALVKKIMETTEQEQLLTLQQTIEVPDDLVQNWSDGLKKILHESNSAKVFMVFLSCRHATVFLSSVMLHS